MPNVSAQIGRAVPAPRVPKRVAAVILNSLKGGVVPRIGLPYITVGRDIEIQALLADLGLIAEGGASFRFLVGRYGDEALFDQMGDTVLEYGDAGPELIEDYLDDVKELLGHA